MNELSTFPVSRKFPARRVEVESKEDGPLAFRPICVADAEQIKDHVESSRAELKPFMPWSHKPSTLEQEIARVRESETEYYAGTDMVMGLFRESEMLTMVGLHPRVPLNPQGLEVGYWAPTRYTRRGYTTLGVRIAAVYAFDKLGCDRLQVSHDEANVASRRVVEKCGFEREGILRNHTAKPSPDLVEGGFRWTGRHPFYALFPDTFEAQPWVNDLRSRLRYFNIAGHPV